MKGDRDVGKNWHLRLRNIIDKLKKKNEKLYLENQIMKRRLAKHEGSRRMVTYYNKKVSV